MYRAKMTRENRAKQFAPFAALGGFDQALEQKLRELGHTERRELSDDSAREIDETLRRLRRGDRVSIRYYCEREYRSVTGSVERLDEVAESLKIGRLWIPIGDIIALSVEDSPGS